MGIPKPNKGFTLLELMITLSILCVFAMMSCGAFSSFFSKYLQDSEVDKIFHALQLARTEAIKRNQIMRVCGSDDLQHCSTQWSKGFIIQVHSDEAKPLFIGAISPQTFVDSKGISQFLFHPDGRCLSRGSIYVHSNTQRSRIVLFDSGRIRIEKNT